MSYRSFDDYRIHDPYLLFFKLFQIQQLEPFHLLLPATLMIVDYL